jgi:hypothetical protein
MTEEEARKKLNTDEGFAFAKRYDYSMRKLEERYPEPEGAPDNVIGVALMIPEDQVEPAYAKVVLKMRGLMGVEV